MKTDRQRRWDRILPLAATALSGLVALFIGMYFVWVLLWPVNPLNIKSINVPSPQHPGTAMTYSVDYCRNTTLPAVVTRSIIGVGSTTFNVPFPPVGSITVPGCRTTHVVLPLTAALPPGTYYLQVAAHFDIHGSFRSDTVITRSNVFRVTK